MSPTNLKHVQRHPEYYIDGGDLFILVDNTFFRLHSYFLKRDSLKFRELLDSTPESGKPRKGAEESSAIQIRDATPEEFAKFLWVFYNKTFDQYRATVEEWTSVLKIACNHDFPNVKDFAVRSLESCDIPIANRIKLYQKYEVDSSYLVPLFVKLCLRIEGPTDEETDIMGTKVALIIYRARERLRSPASSPFTGSQHPISETDAFEAISSILGYSLSAPMLAGPATPTGPNGVTTDKKNPTHKSKANTDKNGKSANCQESKAPKP